MGFDSRLAISTKVHRYLRICSLLSWMGQIRGISPIRTNFGWMHLVRSVCAWYAASDCSTSSTIIKSYIVGLLNFQFVGLPSYPPEKIRSLWSYRSLAREFWYSAAVNKWSAFLVETSIMQGSTQVDMAADDRAVPDTWAGLIRIWFRRFVRQMIVRCGEVWLRLVVLYAPIVRVCYWRREELNSRDILSRLP